jgi:flagellar FliL protein
MAKNKSGGTFKFIKNVLAVALIVAASVGATLFYYAKTNTATANTAMSGQPAEAPPVALPNPIFTPLEPFTVTLRNEQTSRILYVAITLRVTDELSRRQLNQYMPEVRDRTLRLLAEQKADHVQTPQGRSELVNGLLAALKAPYAPQPTGPAIENVLFTAFVVQ